MRFEDVVAIKHLILPYLNKNDKIKIYNSFSTGWSISVQFKCTSSNIDIIKLYKAIKFSYDRP